MVLRRNTIIAIRPSVYIYLSLLLFAIPLPWIAAWFAAVIFHELCHWVGVRLCGGEVLQFSLAVGGANMESTVMTDGKRLFSVLCGPLGGLFLAAFSRWLPRIAICSWFLSMYNLIPVMPLDGGNALQILIKNEKLHRVVEGIILGLLASVAIYTSLFLRLGILPLLIVFILWRRNRKIPCKECVCKVQ